MNGNPTQKTDRTVFSSDTTRIGNSRVAAFHQFCRRNTGVNSVPLAKQLIDSCNGAQVTVCEGWKTVSQVDRMDQESLFHGVADVGSRGKRHPRRM